VLDAIRTFVSQHIARVTPSTSDAPAPAVSPNVQLAACALLLELAYADGEFSASERAHIEGALDRHFGLDEATACKLVELAEAERTQSIDHFQFTRLIVDQYDLGQRMVLAEVMWGVILADQEIAQHEGYLIRKLAKLLDLEPAYLSQARQAAEGPR
jgi:uncharacterized tellurite resistance protein B-like protein